MSLLGVLEALETRAVPAAISWIGGNGGFWSVAANWSNGAVPTAADDVTINLAAAGDILFSQTFDAAHSITTNSNADLVMDSYSTLQVGGGTSNLGGGMLIAPGGSLSFGAGAVINVDTQRIDVQGLMTVNRDSTLNFTGGTAQNPGGILVSGRLTVNSATLRTTGGLSSLEIFGNGRMVANNSTFAMTEVDYVINDPLPATDLSNNDFSGTVISLDPTDVSSLRNNRLFGVVNLSTFLGYLPANTNLVLPQLGPSSAGFYYRFDGDYVVSAGSTLSFAPGIRVDLAYPNPAGQMVGTRLTVDGTVYFDNNTVQFMSDPALNSRPGGLDVNGFLNTRGSTFRNLDGSAATSLVVNNGGLLTGSGNTFAGSRTSFADGALLEVNGTPSLTGNDFSGTVVDIKATMAPQLVNNLRFGEVDLRSGTLGGGGNDPQTLRLTAMGTASSAGLNYVFAGNYTVAAGATLAVDPNVTLRSAATSVVTVNGTLSLGAGDTVNLATVAVGNTGAFQAPGLNLTVGRLTVNSGGRFTATSSAIVGDLIFGPGSIDSLTSSSLAGTLTIDQTSQSPTDATKTATITQNNFAAIGAKGIIATGTTTAASNPAQIDLTGNRWGTGDPASITAKIRDRRDLATLPLVVFDPIQQEPATVTATAATAVYGSVDQTVTLTASVSSNGGTVNEGTVTFGVFDVGGNLIGGLRSGPVINGVAAVGYTLPAGTPAGAYDIQVVFNGSNRFVAATGAPQSLSITPAPTLVGAPASPVLATYSARADQNVRLRSTVSSLVGTVNQGTVTYTIATTGTNPVPVGSPLTVNVVNGVASGSFLLPALTAGGTYTVSAIYNGTTNYVASSVETFNLVVNPAPVNLSTLVPFPPYSTSARTLPFSGFLTSIGGTVNEGTLSVTILDTGDLVSPTVTVDVANGTAQTFNTLPAGLNPGAYRVQFTYNGTGNFAPVTVLDVMTIGSAVATIGVGSTRVVYAPTDRPVRLTADITSAGGIVNEGTATFAVYDGTTLLGLIDNVPVQNGSASTGFTIPGGTRAGSTLSVMVRYQGSFKFTATGTAEGSITIDRAVPTIAIPTPSPIVFGTPLSAALLAATASVDGTFRFDPDLGTVLGAGAGQVITISFTPTDAINYTDATASTRIDVLRATPTFSVVTPPQSLTRGTSPLVLGGRLSAPTAIPVGQVVTIRLASDSRSVSATATVNPDATFAAVVDVASLGGGTYSLTFEYAGDSNFAAAATTTAGFVLVTPAPQALTPLVVPTTAVFGQTFRIAAPTSGSGLPVTVTGVNARVVATADGGYDVTPTSGTAPVILIASQAGNEDYAAAAEQTATIATAKAVANVTLVVPGPVVFNGQRYLARVATNPAGLATSVVYTRNGQPVVAPVDPGSYVVTAVVDDPNYQGSATASLEIRPTTPTPPPVDPTVSITSVAALTGRRGLVQAIRITLGGTLSEVQVEKRSLYRLLRVGPPDSCGNRQIDRLRIAAADFDAATNAVTLRLVKPVRVGSPLQLRVTGLTDRPRFAVIRRGGPLATIRAVLR